jgi:hypothetical protein
MVLEWPGRGRRPPQDPRRGKDQAWLAGVALGAGAPIGGCEPLTCGAVGVLRPLSRAPAESHHAALSLASSNGKTGPIAVSSPSRLNCSSSCALAAAQGCYAEAGFHTRLHWSRFSFGRDGITAAAFIQQVAALPAGVILRHCVDGDQWPDPPDPLCIDQALLLQLARATRHLRAAWSYIHFPMSPANQASLRLRRPRGWWVCLH